MAELLASEFAHLINDDEPQENIQTSNLQPASTSEISEVKLTENATILKDLETQEIDDETEEKIKRRLVVKYQEALKLDEYHFKLQQTTIKTFVDRPDEVRSLSLVKSTPNTLVLEWQVPCANNSTIIGYRVYCDDKFRLECATC